MKIKKAGFTLVEMFVVVSILTVIGVGLFSAIEIGKYSRNANVALSPQSSTAKQRDLRWLHKDTKPGAVKHLYVISANNGQVIVYLYQQGAGGVYQQFQVASGPQVVLVSDRPLVVNDNVISMDTAPRLETDK